MQSFIDRIPIRIFIFLCMSCIIIVVSLGTDIILMKEARHALIAEKQNKLFALTKIMDKALPAGFDQILEAEGMLDAPKEQQIQLLNRRLAPLTDAIATSEHGIGVGYYSKRLDVIITYGPSSSLGDKVGLAIGSEHQGREVMSKGEPMVQTAGLVRGMIMNCMQPLIRNQEVIGYIWANELVDTINDQVRKMYVPFYITIGFGLLFSFIGTAFIAQGVSTRIEEITRAITLMEKDLSYRIPTVTGELGPIAASVNNFAEQLQSRRRIEERMQRTDRLAALGEIAAGVAHEIRNPLTSIKGFVQLIESGMTADDTRRKYTSIVISETERLNKLIHELLYYARPNESLKMQIDINRILSDTLLLVNLNASHHNVTIQTDFQDNLPRIKGDSEQLKQLFLNLIINAAQAATQAEHQEGGHVTVKTRHLEKSSIRVIVEDDGIGICESNRSRLFDPFFTTKDNGTGLGLAVVQKISSLHNGEIEVENRAEGGARFTVTLPIGTDTAPAAKGSSPSLSTPTVCQFSHDR